MNNIKFLDLNAQYLSIKSEIDEAIANVIAKSAFIGGKFVEAFEREFAEFIGVKYALGVANGTDALEITLEALELPIGSEVLVPANSFAATAEAVVRNNLKVVFVDCDESYTIDIDDLRAKITPQTRAILPVHLYGQSANIDAVMALANEFHLHVIEDCAQAHGTSFNGRKVGGFGLAGCFSFYPGKNLGAYGDGGMIVSNDEKFITKCREIARHGALKKYHHLKVGRNSRLDALQAAILSVKLRHLNSWIKKRQKLAGIYLHELSNITGIALPQVRELHECVWHLFVLRVTDNAENLANYLKKRGIESGYHYPIALPKLEAFNGNPHVKADKTPNACNWDSHLISLPMGEHLSVEQVEYVIEGIKSWSKEAQAWFNKLSEKIETYREKLIAEARELHIIDYGAGDPNTPRSKELMQQGITVVSDTSKMAKIGIKGENLAYFLEVVREAQPKHILELGTCCGFSSAYLSHAAPNAKIYTIEGAPRVAEIAQETRRNLGVNNVVQKVGRFSDVLPELLPQIAPLDFVFIDGHHDRDATIGYFHQILPFMNERGIMVFDDITWSEGMKEAWAQILAFGAHKRESSDGKIGVLWL